MTELIAQEPATQDIRFVAGDDFTIPIQIGTEDANGTFTATNVTGYTFESAVTGSFGGINATISIIDAPTGSITVTWSDSQTGAIRPNCYRWFLGMTDTAGYERTIVYGNAEVLSRG